MSPMISRVMAAILMLPLAAVVYVIAFVAFTHRGNSTVWSGVEWVAAGSFAWAFVAVYWWLVWRRAVVWTTHRKNGTVLAALEAIAIAAATGIACAYLITTELAYWAASVVAPLSWLLLTVYAWRETRDERGPRVAGANGPIACPECDYDLTGLKGTRCPECGTEFTLDELIGSPVERIASDLK